MSMEATIDVTGLRKRFGPTVALLGSPPVIRRDEPFTAWTPTASSGCAVPAVAGRPGPRGLAAWATAALLTGGLLLQPRDA